MSRKNRLTKLFENNFSLLPETDGGSGRPRLYRHYISKNPIARSLLRIFFDSLLNQVQQTEFHTVLDVGCGIGIVPRLLSYCGEAVDLYGLDIRDDFILIAREVAPQAKYIVGDAYALPFANHSMDLVICLEVLEHLQTPAKALAEIARVSRHYGVFSVPHEPWWRLANLLRGKYWRARGNTPGHINHWSAKEFLALLKPYFDIVSVQLPFPWILVLGRKN